MSPKSKRRSLEKSKGYIKISLNKLKFLFFKYFCVLEANGCSRSLIDETTETDSENYAEFNRTKIKVDHLLGIFFYLLDNL